MRRNCSIAVLLLLALTGCARGTPTDPVSPQPEVDPDPRTRTFPERGVWVSRAVEGGAFSDAWMEGDSILVLRIRPENVPINPSAWYGFAIGARAPDTVRVRLSYENGRHRYWPKLRRQGASTWAPLDSSDVQVSPTASGATLTLAVGPDTVWVAGQEMMTSAFFSRWTDSLASLPGVERRELAISPLGRPIHILRAGNPAATRHIAVIGRQHPPEVTGTIALVAYLEEVLGDSPLAREFRERFQIHTVPLMNPDGVDLGYWRHNTGGVDLNRDWAVFSQPETRAVRDEFRQIMTQPDAELWFMLDFHATDRDVFYTLDRDLETRPAGITDRWIGYLSNELPHYQVNDAPSGLRTIVPGEVSDDIARNWFYREFRAPGLTYETGDNTDRALLREVASTAARGTMTLLLDELQRAAGERPQ